MSRWSSRWAGGTPIEGANSVVAVWPEREKRENMERKNPPLGGVWTWGLEAGQRDRPSARAPTVLLRKCPMPICESECQRAVAWAVILSITER